MGQGLCPQMTAGIITPMDLFSMLGYAMQTIENRAAFLGRFQSTKDNLYEL
jgi:hypothetical protein